MLEDLEFGSQEETGSFLSSLIYSSFYVLASILFFVRISRNLTSLVDFGTHFLKIVLVDLGTVTVTKLYILGRLAIRGSEYRLATYCMLRS